MEFANSSEPKSKIETFKKIKNLEHLTNIFFNNRRKMIKTNEITF